MQKQDYIDVIKVNAAPITALALSNGWHLDDFVKITTIVAMLVSIGYTCWKWWMGVKRNRPLDTVTGDK
jgi:hypothetical protein